MPQNLGTKISVKHSYQPYLLFTTGEKVACMINNLGGMSVLEMNVIANETIKYLGKSDTFSNHPKF